MQGLSTSPLLKTYRLEEFWKLPEPTDRSKLELIAGVLYMTPPPEPTNDKIVSRIIRIISSFLSERGWPGRLYVPRAAIWTSSDTYLEPDLFYIPDELEARLNPDHRETASLVVEVISPGSAVYDRNTKADTYGALGVRELWLVNPTDQIIEMRLQSGAGFDDIKTYRKGETLESTVLEGFRLPVDKVFDFDL